MILLLLGIIFILLGGFMFFLPQKSVKKDLQDSEEELKKAKRNGLIIAIGGFILVLATILL